MKNDDNSFWLTNISNRNVSLADLNLTIKPFASIDLLSNRYYYTKEEIQKSVESGSIFAKRDKIFVRNVAPVVIEEKIQEAKNVYIPNRQRSTFSIKEDYFEELELDDKMAEEERFAAENADFSDFDYTVHHKGES